MESFADEVLGSPEMKSIEISSQGAWGTDGGVYKPWGKYEDLACLQSKQLAANFSTSIFILGQKKC